jgi:hypothetical protein
MLPAAGYPPRDVLAVLRQHAARSAGEDQLPVIGAQPLSGGRNNAVYQWVSPTSGRRPSAATPAMR